MRLEEKAEFIAFLDKARWSNSKNYDTINYSHNNMSDDQKLLTHWLCYISDRQMSYKQIWDVGGFVYSDLVHEYSDGKSVEELLNINGDKSFFVKNDDKRKTDENGDEIPAFMFLSRQHPNETIKKMYSSFIVCDDKVKFTSRYYPSDYISIYYTLTILDNKIFNRSFTTYIAKVIERALECYNSKEEIITKKNLT